MSTDHTGEGQPSGTVSQETKSAVEYPEDLQKLINEYPASGYGNSAHKIEDCLIERAKKFLIHGITDPQEFMYAFGLGMGSAHWLHQQQTSELRKEVERLIAGIRRGQILSDNIKWSDEPGAEGFTANESEIIKLQSNLTAVRSLLDRMAEIVTDVRHSKDVDEILSMYETIDTLLQEYESIKKV